MKPVAKDGEAVAALARRHRSDLVMNAVAPQLVMPIFEGALEAGTHCMDMAASLSARHPTHPFTTPGLKLGDLQFERQGDGRDGAGRPPAHLTTSPRIRLDWSHQTDTEVRAMNVDEMLQGARDTMTVSRVYSEPIERNGVMLIPAADIKGGGGGGSDTEHNGGGGFGVSARPVGTWIIRGDQVTWEPAVDVNRIALRGMVVAIVFLFVVRSLVKSFTRRS
jgi:uncharacterized spore protein YtfJ